MKYLFRDRWYSVAELSAMSGIAPPTIRDRLRRGYPLEEALKAIPTSESVIQFNEASYWEDWIGMSISDLHTIYWKWCVSHEYTPLARNTFSRQLLQLYPMLYTVPTDGQRVVRMRG